MRAIVRRPSVTRLQRKPILSSRHRTRATKSGSRLTRDGCCGRCVALPAASLSPLRIPYHQPLPLSYGAPQAPASRALALAVARLVLPSERAGSALFSLSTLRAPTFYTRSVSRFILFSLSSHVLSLSVLFLSFPPLPLAHLRAPGTQDARSNLFAFINYTSTLTEWMCR